MLTADLESTFVALRYHNQIYQMSFTFDIVSCWKSQPMSWAEGASEASSIHCASRQTRRSSQLSNTHLSEVCFEISFGLLGEWTYHAVVNDENLQRRKHGQRWYWTVCESEGGGRQMAGISFLCDSPSFSHSNFIILHLFSSFGRFQLTGCLFSLVGTQRQKEEPVL